VGTGHLRRTTLYKMNNEERGCVITVVWWCQKQLAVARAACAAWQGANQKPIDGGHIQWYRHSIGCWSGHSLLYMQESNGQKQTFTRDSEHLKAAIDLSNDRTTEWRKTIVLIHLDIHLPRHPSPTTNNLETILMITNSGEGQLSNHYNHT
jgi:hypothetical protein